MVTKEKKTLQHFYHNLNDFLKDIFEIIEFISWIEQYFFPPKNVELYSSFSWGESKKSSQAKASTTSGQKTQAREVGLLPPEQHLQSYVGRLQSLSQAVAH